MRTIFVSLLTTSIGLGLLPSAATPQEREKKDSAKVLDSLFMNVKQKANVEARIEAIMALAEFGPEAAPALPDLLDALQAKNEGLRLNASVTLSKIGKPAAAPVAKLLKAPDASTRFYALWTLGWIGPDARETVPAVIDALGDKDVEVRRKAAFALGRLESEATGVSDRTLSALVNAFTDDSDEVRQAAGDALARYGKAAVPPLIGLLKRGKPGTRLQAATTLGDIGEDAKDAVPALKDRFLAQDSEDLVHYAAMLAKIGNAAVPALAAGFKDARPGVRGLAAQTLAEIGGDGIGVLVDGLGDKNVDIRRQAAFTLGSMQLGDKTVVAGLAFALADEDDIVRVHCINALAELGPLAKLAADKVKDALTDMHPEVRIQSYKLLTVLDADLKTTLTKKLASKTDKTRINAACLMVDVGFEMEGALPIVIEALKNNDPGLRLQAAYTLVQQNLLASQDVPKDRVMPIFIANLKHKSAGLRSQAAQGLGFLGKGAASAGTDLAETLGDPDAAVRLSVVRALYTSGADPAKVAPILAMRYRDGDPGVRSAVLQIASTFRPRTDDLILAGLKDQDDGVRQSAVASLFHPQHPKDFLPSLARLVKDKDQETRMLLIPLFEIVGEAGAVPLGEMLKDGDDMVRGKAAQFLSQMGPKAIKALPAVKDAIKAAIKDDNVNVRVNLMELLAKIGGDGPAYLVTVFPEEKYADHRAHLLGFLAGLPDKKVALSLLPTAMKDPHLSVRRTTVGILGHLGPDTKEGFEAFAFLLKDTDVDVRTTAAYLGPYYGKKSWGPLETALPLAKDLRLRAAILVSMNSAKYRSKNGVPALIECLKGTDLSMQHLACKVLTGIGLDAAPALPRLRELAKGSEVVEIREAARLAVKAIEAEK